MSEGKVKSFFSIQITRTSRGTWCAWNHEIAAGVIKGKPSPTAIPPEEQSKSPVWSQASFWKNSILQLQEMRGSASMAQEIFSCLGLLWQALLHISCRSCDNYLFIIAPGAGSLAGVLSTVWGGWALSCPGSSMCTDRTAACWQMHRRDGFGKYLHLHSSPPCPILLSLPSMHL